MYYGLVSNNGKTICSARNCRYLKGTENCFNKNPVNPDISLWLGGVERLYNAGIKT
jgi:hypothetical protein